MITSVIEANDKRHVAFIDIPGDYLHALMDAEELMTLIGNLGELMVMVHPKIYPTFLTYDNKMVVLLYVKMNKAMYLLLKSAFLFYKRLVDDIEAYGFKISR